MEERESDEKWRTLKRKQIKREGETEKYRKRGKK
jgi:hypothetical protein